MIRVIAIDDHPLMLKIIRTELSGQPDIEYVGEADHGSKLLQLVRETSPHLVVLDLAMADKGFEPITAVRELRQLYPQLNVLVLTGHHSVMYMRQITAAGARGYLLKSDGNSLNLADAVRRVHQGELVYSSKVVERLLEREKQMTLNEQEVGIIRLVEEGNSNQRIGSIIGLSERRIRNILTGIYAKIGTQEDTDTNRRTALVAKARELGLLDQE